MRHSLVIGSEGQDGRLLYDLLERRGGAVAGLGRGTARASHGFSEAAFDGGVDLQDPAAVRALFDAWRPDDIYYLAAHHHAARQTREPPAELYRLSHAVHVDGLLNVLAAMTDVAPAARLFYAASSHVFGRPAASPQDESTPLNPANVYAVTKVAALHLCRLFREGHGLHASVGILYNHESPLRKADFVSQRIVRGAIDVAGGRADRLELGDVSAVVDWGWAGDTVDAMTRVLDADAGEYVVATGIPHTVADFAEAAFAAVGLDWRRHVRSGPPGPPAVPLVGNAAKLRAATGWTPTMSFEEMVRALVCARLQNTQHG